MRLIDYGIQEGSVVTLSFLLRGGMPGKAAKHTELSSPSASTCTSNLDIDLFDGMISPPTSIPQPPSPSVDLFDGMVGPGPSSSTRPSPHPGSALDNDPLQFFSLGLGREVHHQGSFEIPASSRASLPSRPESSCMNDCVNLFENMIGADLLAERELDAVEGSDSKSADIDADEFDAKYASVDDDDHVISDSPLIASSNNDFDYDDCDLFIDGVPFEPEELEPEYVPSVPSARAPATPATSSKPSRQPSGYSYHRPSASTSADPRSYGGINRNLKPRAGPDETAWRTRRHEEVYIRMLTQTLRTNFI